MVLDYSYAIEVPFLCGRELGYSREIMNTACFD